MSRRHHSRRRHRYRIPLSGRGIAIASLGLAFAMLCGVMLGRYTIEHIRRDFAYGYSVPDPEKTGPFGVAEYEKPRPKRFGQDAAFHAVVTGDEAPSFESVYFPDGADADAD